MLDEEIGNLEELHRELRPFVETDEEIKSDIELVDDDIESASDVVKNLVDTVSLIIRADKCTKNQMLNFWINFKMYLMQGRKKQS